MKKYLILLFLTLLSCNNPKKVWDFSLGESMVYIESTLKNKDYSYQNNDGKIELESSITYLGIKWDGVSFNFENNFLSSISFRMFKGEKLTREQKKYIVDELDKIYGDHVVDNSAKAEYGTVAWKWEKDNINVLFTTIFKSQWASLIIFDDTYNNSANSCESKTNANFDPKKIWIFEMGQPVKDALDSIRNNKLTFTETQYLYRIDSQIEFLGVNWNTVRIGKDKILDAIFFDNDAQNMLSYSEKQALISKLDELYGAHDSDSSVAGGDYTWYHWYKGGVKVTYAPMEQIGETLEFSPSK